MLRTQPYPEKDTVTQLGAGEEEENIVGMKRQVKDRKVVKKKKKKEEKGDKAGAAALFQT